MSEERWHGTSNGYSYYGCRCAACTEANRLHVGRYRRSEAIRVKDGSEWWHGTTNGYRNHGCRCEACADAHRVAMRDWHERTQAKRAVS